VRHEARGLHERIHEALEEPVEEAEKLLSELTSPDAETKLSILISGWGRALAAALEELAIAIDELREADVRVTPEWDEATATHAQAEEQTATDDRSEQSEQLGAGDVGEQRLIDEAKKSREATAELRQEGEQARHELEH
jgi:hypothetical protein